jgi:hypothetical protein
MCGHGDCEKPATCVGIGPDRTFACNDCCDHGGEESPCVPLDTDCFFEFKHCGGELLPTRAR